MKTISSILLVAIGASPMQSHDFANAIVFTAKELNDYVYGPMGYYSTVFSGVYYAGSDSKFHYFVIRHNRKSVKFVKLTLENYHIGNPIKLDSDKKKWIDVTHEFPFPPKVN